MSHWFEPIADHAGAAYLRYSFTKGTEQEVAFLMEEVGVAPGDRLLDVGCGPGRHAHALAGLGVEVVGVDISRRFVELAAAGPGHFVRGDARALPAAPGSFDVAISLCQGGFGLVGARDADVVRQMAGAVRVGGLVVVSAFSAYFAVRFLEETDDFDAAAGVNHERTSVRDEDGQAKDFDLWTSCFTPRELALVAERAGLSVEAIWSVTPGAYAADPPDLDHPEYLLVGRRQEFEAGRRSTTAWAKGPPST